MKSLIRYIALFSIFAILISACGSVRSRSNSSKNPSDNSRTSKSGIAKKGSNKSKFVQSSAVESRNRFADTTYIYLDGANSSNEIEISEASHEELYRQALNKFNNEDYNSACNNFKVFLENYTLRDNIYYDARFHLGECLVLNNSISEAIDIFNNILNSQNVPDEVIQQALVRLGQVYCSQNKMSLAQRYFTRLRNEYPKSIYLKVANCN